MKRPLISALLMGTLATVIAASSAQADGAATVFGSSGTAKLCYDGADRGGDPGAYIFYCDQALNTSLSPHDRAATFINRGVIRLELNEVNFALTDFDAGLAIDPSIGEGYVDRGASLIEKKQFAEAIRSIDKGLSLGARRPGLAYYDRAIAHEQMGDLCSAYKDFQLAQVDNTLASDQLKRFTVVPKPGGNCTLGSS